MMSFDQASLLIALLGGAIVAMLLALFVDFGMEEPQPKEAHGDASEFEEFYMDLLTYDEFSREEAEGLYQVWQRVGDEIAMID